MPDRVITAGEVEALAEFLRKRDDAAWVVPTHLDLLKGLLAFVERSVGLHEKRLTDYGDTAEYEEEVAALLSEYRADVQ
jgi:hypothetical protein